MEDKMTAREILDRLVELHEFIKTRPICQCPDVKQAEETEQALFEQMLAAHEDENMPEEVLKKIIKAEADHGKIVGDLTRAHMDRHYGADWRERAEKNPQEVPEFKP